MAFKTCTLTSVKNGYATTHCNRRLKISSPSERAQIASPKLPATCRRCNKVRDKWVRQQLRKLKGSRK